MRMLIAAVAVAALAPAAVAADDEPTTLLTVQFDKV
jgi:hypothetical protein